jgi:beta-propeller uncharacterized protein DUF5122
MFCLVVRRYASVVIVLAGLLALASTASATLSETPDQIWEPNGGVTAVARSPDRIYLGGQFTRVAPVVGGFAQFATGSGQLQGSARRFTLASGAPGFGEAVVDDGAGGYYVGGRFDAVGGVARHNLAHILADGSLDPAFAPDPDGEVSALARGGTTIYAAGAFTTIGGAARTHVAAVDSTGHATAWAPVLDATPLAIAVSGSTVYLGGRFTTINSAPRPNAGAVDATTGATTDWDPQPNDYVYRIAPAGSSVFIAGGFGMVHGTLPVSGLAKVDATTGVPVLWGPFIHRTSTMLPAVTALAVSGSTLFIGGAFDMVAGSARNNAAALDTGTGALQTWNPNVGASDGLDTPSVAGLAVSGSTVYVTGSFQTINGTVARTSLAAVDATTGTASPWAPWLGRDTSGIALSGDTIGVAGDFGLAGGVARNNVASLDAGDGTATDWNPNVDDTVRAIALDGSNVFLGGDFTKVGPATRVGLAKVDATTGAAVPTWDADLNNSDLALTLSGRTLYVGGAFNGGHSVGEFGRQYVAAVDADTGTVSPWAPGPDAEVSSIAVAGDVVYLGGAFTTLDGGVTTRSHVGAVTTAGTVTDWNPGAAPSGPLAAFGSSVFLAGSFPGPTSVEAVDATTAALRPPTVDVPDPLASVDSVATDDATLFLGGTFTAVDGQPRDGLAAIDLATGTVSSWHPAFGPSPTLQHIAVDGRGGVLTAPDFTSFSALPRATTPPTLSTPMPAAGQPATCATGTWDGSIPQHYAFAWLSDGTVISGAGGATYTPIAGDVGHALSCRVTATNLGGSATADSATATISSPVAVQPDKTRPVISSLKLSPSKFVAAKRGPSIAAAKKPAKKAAAAKKRGTSVSYRVSEAATVVFAVQRRTTGRRSGRSCVKATKRLRHHKRCTRYVGIKGSFTRKRAAGGTDKLRFTGRLAGHTLGAARYRLDLVATDPSKNRSAAATAAFIVKRH